MRERVLPPLTNHLVIRVSEQTKQFITSTAKSYGLHPTTFARVLLEREMPNYTRNRLFG